MFFRITSEPFRYHVLFDTKIPWLLSRWPSFQSLCLHKFYCKKSFLFYVLYLFVDNNLAIFPHDTTSNCLEKRKPNISASCFFLQKPYQKRNKNNRFRLITVIAPLSNIYSVTQTVCRDTLKHKMQSECWEFGLSRNFSDVFSVSRSKKCLSNTIVI